MSKKISGALVLLTLLCLCTGSFLPHSHAQTAAAGTAQNAAIVSTTAAVLKETSELRELSILKAVKSGAQSRAEIEGMIVRNLDSETTPAEMHAAEMVLKSFGLAPENFSYRPFLIKLLTEQVAGYYDPKVQQFYLADWIELEGQKPVMAHELTHALQDQHFNLKRFENWPKGDSDAELAAHALIEGDATLAMTLYMAKNPLVALAFIKSLGSQDLATEQLNRRHVRCASRCCFRMKKVRHGPHNFTSVAGGSWFRVRLPSCRSQANRSFTPINTFLTRRRRRSRCRSLRLCLVQAGSGSITM